MSNQGVYDLANKYFFRNKKNIDFLLSNLERTRYNARKLIPKVDDNGYIRNILACKLTWKIMDLMFFQKRILFLGYELNFGKIQENNQGY